MIVVYPTPATSILSLPLPANAAQETGGNLAALNAFNTQILVDMLSQILKELQITNQLLASGLGTRDDPSQMRADASFPM